MGDQNQTGQGPAVPPQAKEEAKRGVTHTRKAAEDLRSAAGAMVVDRFGNFYGATVHGGTDDDGCVYKFTP